MHVHKYSQTTNKQEIKSLALTVQRFATLTMESDCKLLSSVCRSSLVPIKITRYYLRSHTTQVK